VRHKDLALERSGRLKGTVIAQAHRSFRSGELEEADGVLRRFGTDQLVVRPDLLVLGVSKTDSREGLEMR